LNLIWGQVIGKSICAGVEMGNTLPRHNVSKVKVKKKSSTKKAAGKDWGGEKKGDVRCLQTFGGPVGGG